MQRSKAAPVKIPGVRMKFDGSCDEGLLRVTECRLLLPADEARRASYDEMAIVTIVVDCNPSNKIFKIPVQS